MSRRKARLEIGQRAFEEVDKIFNVRKYGGTIMATKTIGCHKNAIYEWGNGKSPDAIHLQRLHELGADVIYILTGVRKNGR
jgi:hypothetical protein